MIFICTVSGDEALHFSLYFENYKLNNFVNSNTAFSYNISLSSFNDIFLNILNISKEDKGKKPTI